MKIALFVLFAFFNISYSYADYLIEPNFGFAHGEYNSKHDGTKFQYDSFVFGSKFGYQYMGIFGGLDTSFSLPSLEQRFPVLSNPPKTEYFHWTVGPTLGYRFPFLLKIWASYFLHTQYDSKSGDRKDTLSGTGYAIGGGYQLSFIPYFDLFANLEIRRLKISKVSDDQTGKIYHTQNPATEILLTFSVPIEFKMNFSN